MKRVLTILAAVAALAVSGLSAAVGPAAAADNNPGTESEDHSTCRLETEEATIFYPAGTKITVVVDGKKEVWVCRDSKWRKKSASLLRGPATVESLDHQSVVAIQ
jgi:hypothetical protein